LDKKALLLRDDKPNGFRMRIYQRQQERGADISQRQLSSAIEKQYTWLKDAKM